MSDKTEGKAGAAPAKAVRSHRSRTLLIAECRRATGEVHPIRVRDLSATGLRGLCSKVTDFAPGEPVRIAFPNLAPIRARVARYAKGELGISFHQPIDLELVARARADPARIPPNLSAAWVTEWISRASQERDELFRP